MTNLVELLPRTQRRALVEPGGREIRFDTLRQEVEELAGGLHQQGLQEGDRVVLLIPMGIDLYRCLLALFHLGASAVLVDPAGPVEQNLARVAPQGLIGVPRAHLLRLKTPSLRGLAHYYSTGFCLLPHRRLSSQRGPPPPIAGAENAALITFTTGTTGLPKCMARNHQLLLAQHHALRSHMDLSPEDVDLPTLPVFLLHSLACGATCVIPDADLRHPGTVDPSRVLTQMDREGVNCSSGSPAFFARLADKLVKDGEQFHGLKRLFIGGARVPSPLLRKLAQVFPAAEVHVVYGSTEAEPIAVLDATQGIDELEEGEAEGRGILVGTPVPSVDVQVLDDEICVAGAHVNPGYLDDPVATASHKIREPLPQGGERIWHRTGDAGFLDDQGRIWLVGRTGQNVAGHWPFQVESRAERLDFVHRAGLVSLEGQATLGVVLVDPPQDWHELLLAQTGLPGIRIESMPLDPRHNAKINRPALIALLDQARAEPTAPN